MTESKEIILDKDTHIKKGMRIIFKLTSPNLAIPEFNFGLSHSNK